MPSDLLITIVPLNAADYGATSKSKPGFKFTSLETPISNLLLSFADAPTLLQLDRTSKHFHEAANRDMLWKV